MYIFNEEGDPMKRATSRIAHRGGNNESQLTYVIIDEGYCEVTPPIVYPSCLHLAGG